MLTWLADALRAARLPAAEVDGWETRTRPKPTTDPVHFNPEGVLLHHTAGHKDLGVVVNGRPGLAGPLANLYISREPRVHIVAAGRANHAGSGCSILLDRIRRGLPPAGDAFALGYVDDMVGNGRWIGIEIENLGVASDPFPPVQADLVDEVCAVLCAHEDWQAHRVAAHREWTRRKIDPLAATWSMANTRHRVAMLLKGEDLVLDADTKRYFDGQFELIRLGDDPDPVTGDTHPENLRTLDRRTAQLVRLVEAQGRQIEALALAVANLPQTQQPAP